MYTYVAEFIWKLKCHFALCSSKFCRDKYTNIQVSSTFFIKFPCPLKKFCHIDVAKNFFLDNGRDVKLKIKIIACFSKRKF